MLVLIYDNEILTDQSTLSVNFSHVYIIYAEIFEKMLSGDLEVSISIV